VSRFSRVKNTLDTVFTRYRHGSVVIAVQLGKWLDWEFRIWQWRDEKMKSDSKRVAL